MLDGKRGRLIRTVPVAQVPVAVAIDAPGRRVYVASFAGNSVAVLDARTGAVLGAIPVGHCPNDVAVDARTGHAFVANWDDGTVSVIQNNDLKTGSRPHHRIKMARRE